MHSPNCPLATLRGATPVPSGRHPSPRQQPPVGTSTPPLTTCCSSRWTSWARAAFSARSGVAFSESTAIAVLRISRARLVPTSIATIRSTNGARGWRVIATCRTAAGRVGYPVQLGVARSPDDSLDWQGGPVSGYISYEPNHRALIQGAFDRSPKRLMLVVTTPPAGLAANPGPDLSAVPNNHLAYAVQWFLFAGIALVIYLLAVRRRGRG